MQSTWVRFLTGTTLIAGMVGFLGRDKANATGELTGPVIDNERVAVWDITFNPSEPISMSRFGDDVVTLFLSAGDLRITDTSGRSHAVSRKKGEVVFTPRSVPEKEAVTSQNPINVVLIKLKRHSNPPLPNTTGYPLAFPRPGSQKVFENNRIVAWNYTYTVGAHTATHFHDKDVVVVYLGDGLLKSVPLTGASDEQEHRTGDIRFNKANRVHSEVLENGSLSAIVVELK